MINFKTIINLLLPPRCIKCGKILGENNGLCSDCFREIDFISEPFCHRCGRPFTSEAGIKTDAINYCGKCLQTKRFLFTMQRSAFIYNDNSKNLILDFKFRDKTVSAATLSNLLFVAGKDIWAHKPHLLMPVPLHHTRLVQRRYNQSALLVKELADKTGISADYCNLYRKHKTIPQVKLTGQARRRNLHNVFAIQDAAAIKNKKIVLIDDVSTTGSTLNECAKALKKGGAAEIYSLTLAHTEY